MPRDLRTRLMPTDLTLPAALAAYRALVHEFDAVQPALFSRDAYRLSAAEHAVARAAIADAAASPTGD